MFRRLNKLIINSFTRSRRRKFSSIKSTSSKLIETIEKNGVKEIIFNDLKTRHSLSLAMMSQLFEEITQNLENENLRVIVISSKGPVFSAGHNLKEISEMGPEGSREIFDKIFNIIQAIKNAPVPVIAKIDGLVTGAGCQLVASCDMVVCSDRSSFRLATADIGIFAATPAVAITRVMPKMKSFHMLFTGLPLNSQEANLAGLVSCVSKEKELDKTVEDICESIRNKSRIVIKLGKEFYYQQLEMNIWDAYKLAEDVLVKNLKTNDAKEGVESFLDKRKPNWTNS